MNRIPRTWMIANLKKSYRILGMILDGVTQEQAETLREDQSWKEQRLQH